MKTEAATATHATEPAPRNEHWSFSRLSRFESCPLSYKLHYLDRLPSEPTVPLQFGKLIHAVLEELYVEHTLDERVAPLRSASHARTRSSSAPGRAPACPGLSSSVRASRS